jgi:pyruvate dehydrogenase E1 component
MLEEDYGVGAAVWSATSYKELFRDAVNAERQNLLHPKRKPQVPYVESCLGDAEVVVAASDYSKLLPLSLGRWMPKSYTVLGTDGFGRSDGRSALRNFFEVDARYVVLAALGALAAKGRIDQSVLLKAIKKLDIDPDKANPLLS